MVIILATLWGRDYFLHFAVKKIKISVLCQFIVCTRISQYNPFTPPSCCVHISFLPSAYVY